MTPEEQLELSTRIAVALAGRYDDIADLAQDGVVAMLQAPFDGRGDEEKYLGWRARCGMVDAIRRARGFSRDRGSRICTFVTLEEIAEPFSPPPQDLEVKISRVRAAVASLPPREAELVRRHYFADEEQASIARSTGVCPARISQLLARARAQLRLVLHEEDRCDD